MTKRRIDVLLVERGLTESRAQAHALIMAGEVVVGGNAVTRPGTLVTEDVEVAVAQRALYVSRGGIKLAHALERFRVDVAGKVAADIGASTGGFTDCLLQQGARKVYAIDVGYGQLDYRLRKDARVVVMERVNARYPIPLPERVDLATVDVSFISAQKVLPSVSAVLKPGGYIVLLLKPQFEAERREVGKGGVVKDPQLHARILGRFIAWLVQNGYRLKGLTASPIPGPAGNREFFILLEWT